MKLFKNFTFVLCILLASSAGFAKDKIKSDSLTYKGAWFEIAYPKTFTVKSSIASSTPDQFDSAFFISPDKKVKFYVFSPQWSGDATDIAIDTTKEIEKDVKTETKKATTVKWYTYESKDGSKTRSYQETVNEDGPTKFIIGIEYSGRESYKKYKDEYLKFKKSLKQFAD